MYLFALTLTHERMCKCQHYTTLCKNKEYHKYNSKQCSERLRHAVKMCQRYDMMRYLWISPTDVCPSKRGNTPPVFEYNQLNFKWVIQPYLIGILWLTLVDHLVYLVYP